MQEGTGIHTYTCLSQGQPLPVVPICSEMHAGNNMEGEVRLHLSVLLVNVCIRKRQARVHWGVSVLLLAREVECDCPKGHMLGLTLPNPLLIRVGKGPSDRTHLHHRTSSEPIFHE